MTTDIAELRKRAMRDPESLSNAEWKEIHKVAFGVPKKEFNDDNIKVSSSGPSKKRKGLEQWKRRDKLCLSQNLK